MPQTDSAIARTPMVTALAGVTISCPQPDRLADLFTSVLGWRVIAKGAVDEALERAWGIAPGSAGGAYRVVAAADAERGMVRIVSGEARLDDGKLRARWAGVEILVARDLDALYERLVAHVAFRSTHPPLEMDWSEFGSNIHRAFIGLGEGGTHLAFTMAVTRPRGRDFPQTSSGVGYVFDVPLLTTHYDRASLFYRDTLGMTPILESRFSTGPWHELWDLPDGSPVTLDILKGDAEGTGLGGIELQGYAAGLVDESPAEPDRFDGGACMVTYTTNDIEAAHAAAVADPIVTVLGEPVALSAAPYHGARAFTLLGPDGERLEICETLWR